MYVYKQCYIIYDHMTIILYMTIVYIYICLQYILNIEKKIKLNLFVCSEAKTPTSTLRSQKFT